jgi:hypothetical protein
MRIRRTFPLVLAVVVVAAAVTLAVQLRKHAPPEPARLLPGADAFFYLNLNAARRANAGKDLPTVSHDPEYERFIRETGFEFERDLDKAAFAVHYPAKWPGGGTGGSSPEVRYSEVLEGKFHGERFTAYLRQMAKSVESYNSVEIFTVAIEGRSLRVAVLSADSVAASNHDDPAVIHGMVDRSRRLASPFGGPSLLRQYYKHVQLASLVWLVARIDPNSPEAGGWNSVFTKPATLVLSGSALNPLHPMANAVHLRAEAFARSPDEAREIADKMNVFIALTRSGENSLGTGNNDADLKSFFESMQVKQDGEHATVTASLPFGFLHKMLSGSPPESSEPAAASPAQKPATSR